MKEILTHILENILQGPFEISEESSDEMTTFNLKINKEEIGKVIGKGGKTINSIKNVLKIKAIRDGIRIDIQVQEA
ncbi:MAG: hypothetical protein COU27_00610 [Candidatus Levybacteria bacterium CG10_big_fil_rev_8_21_14_0_10_36_7]|nr:MAG: hypothetical protein COU27_00610 [Candidatus Levybacteria bacterium CG10_big_fil_rev_8_21_14_0_10_36_7]